jgi:transposase
MGVLAETRISRQEAAEIAGVSSETVRNWQLTGFNGIKLEVVYVGRKSVTSREALVRFLNAIKKPGTAGLGVA